jgi:hypothetical protein
MPTYLQIPYNTTSNIPMPLPYGSLVTDRAHTRLFRFVGEMSYLDGNQANKDWSNVEYGFLEFTFPPVPSTRYSVEKIHQLISAGELDLLIPDNTETT